jgi:Xaa-Pro aminopeptidase
MIFELGEYRARLSRCRKAMAEKGIEVLIESDPCNMNYLTGYDGWSFQYAQAVIVTLEDEDPLWIGRGVDLAGVRLTTFLPEGNVAAWPDHLVDNAVNHPMEFFAEQLAARSLDRKVIGIDRDCYFFTPRCRDVLRAGLPNARFADAGRLVSWLRLVKSDAEIKVMSEAARLTERIMAAFFEVVRPGLRECDAIAEIYKAQVSGASEFGGGYCCVAPLMPVGEGTSTPHMTWSDRKFVAGEAAYLETAGVRHRYHVPMVRALHLGKAPQRLVDTSKAVIEGIERALDVARPGNTCEQVEAAWRAAIARYSIEKESRIGYSIGLGYPPDWGEHTASLRPRDKTVLQENMTLHMVCGIWNQDWGGVSLSEPFRITAKGAALFADVPRDLYVKT